MSKLFSSSVAIPGAIVIAGALIAWSVFFSGGGGASGVQGSQSSHSGFGNNLSATADNIRPIDNQDHIRGNPNAAVTVVEFSDFECPFCRRLHPTLSQIVTDFPDDVKWVYRHFPLTQIHSRALQASLASECMAELGGNEAFWTFTDTAFANQGNLGDALYEQIAGELGLPLPEFQQCLNSRKHNPIVQANFQDAVNSGGRGTPFAVVINAEGETFPFSGALPYEQIRSIIEAAIAS